MKKGIYYSFILSIFLFLFLSCNNRKGALRENVIGTDQVGSHLEEIIITRPQFENQNMELGQIEMRPFTNSIQANGYIDVPPQNRVDVNAYFGGYVEKIDLLVGDNVKKGQLLCVLVNPEYIQLQQEYLDTKESLVYLKSEYERQKTLASENIASQKNLLKAQSEYKSLGAKNKGLLETLKLLNIDIEQVEQGDFTSRINIYSPISGSISRLHINKGSHISAEEVLMEIIDVNHVHLELQVFEKDILKVKPGLKIEFRIPDAGNELFTGSVHQVGKSIDEEMRMVKVHGHLDDEHQAFVVGMYIEAQIFTDSIVLPSLSKEAVVELGDHHYILSLIAEEDPEMKFIRKHVNLGREMEDVVEILRDSDIKDNEKILVKGAFSLIKDN